MCLSRRAYIYVHRIVTVIEGPRPIGSKSNVSIGLGLRKILGSNGNTKTAVGLFT